MSATPQTAMRKANLAPAEAKQPSERVAGAMRGFAREIGALSAFRLESCIHCGMCADACHFYIATEDPQYTPIWKVEPFKQAYKREASAFAPVYRLLGLKHAVTADELESWQHLLYDSCNLCGRCSLICPMGIDVAALIEQARHAMFEAGLAPKELYEHADFQRRNGQPWPSDEPYRSKLEAIAREHGVPIPIDAGDADVMVLVSGIEVDRYPGQVAAMARLMRHLGARWTLRSDALFAENLAYFAGSREWQRDISLGVIEAAIACKAKTVIVPECGHAYTALRWEAADLYGKPLPFEVRHVTEFLAAELDAGRLRLRKAKGASVTFHDPCQIVRKGGVTEAPRKLMHAIGADLHELGNHKGFSFCCGGGGGVMLIERAAKLRYRAMENKLREVDDSGAQTLLTTCSGCRATFDDGKQHFQWDKTPHSLLELVAAHLATEAEK
jgi:Fe-S oxidoreductase